MLSLERVQVRRSSHPTLRDVPAGRAVTPMVVGLLGCVLLSACRAPRPMAPPPGAVPTPGARAVTPGPVAGLPPVPVVTAAPLAVQVRYPSDNQLISTRDSNFVLGSVGSGDAQLVINGVPVPVAPNGAFLAWLPLPAGPRPHYELVATRGADSARSTVRVRYPSHVVLPASGPLLMDSTSVTPAARTRARVDEWVRVSVRAAASAQVVLQLSDGTQRPLVPPSQMQASARLAAAARRDLTAPAVIPPGTDQGLLFATDVPATSLATAATLIATRSRDTRLQDTMRLAVPMVEVPAAGERLLGMLRSTNAVGADTDHVVNARPIADGTYKWLLLPGTVLEITGRQPGATRVRFDAQLDAWVASEDIVPLPAGTALPRRVSGGLRITPSPDWVDVAIPLGERPPFLVEPDGRQLVLTLYGVQLNPEISPLLGNDTLVRRVAWNQVASDRATVTLSLSRPVYGWLTLWDEARRTFVLRVRRAPPVHADRPLQGLTIAVDPGHPPAGATGPTGLYEGDAVLPVAEELMRQLRDAGATPVLTRETLKPVGLTERAVMSRRLNAHAFVSIHLNALPDGVNPFTANGTSTLFYHQHSEPLARPVQRALMARFGLRDLGVHYQNLAVARPTWYPSVLTEGLFVMIPEQEAAMRDAAFRQRYAEAIVEGLTAYFRELGQP